MPRPRPLLLVPSLLSAVWLASALAGAAALAPYEPEKGCYIGAYVELDNNVSGEIGAFERLTGKKHATYFKYVGYGQPFPYKWVKDLHVQQAVPHIAWEPNDGLSAVRDDEYLHGWAQAAAHAGGPVFLRYASEMNGNWMPYSGDPDLFIAKWKLVYRIMHEEAPNVVMIWCPYATPRATIPQYYPGDEYVDWVGVNLYTVYHADGDPTKPRSEDPRELLRFVYDMFAYRKPIAVCEYAATHYCVATKTPVVDFCLEYMTRMYTALVTQFPRVRMINWFSVNTEENNLAHNNYSVTDNPQVLQTYAQLIASDHFLSRVPDELLVAKASPPTPPTPVPVGPGEPVTPVGPATRPPGPAVPVATSVPLAGTKLGVVAAGGVALVVQGGSPAALTGDVEIVADTGQQLAADSVMFYVDDRFVAMTNVVPFRFNLSASQLGAGEHRLKVVVSNAADRTVGTAEAAVIVAQ
jgi:hypothetical protein